MIRCLLLGLLLLLGLAPAPASAQQWLPGGLGIPVVCAFNSSPPTVASGLFVYAQCNNSGTLLTTGGGGSSSAITVLHAHTTALANNLSVKTSSGNLLGFNCTAITGGAAGYCVVYDGASTPATGALTGANVLDFCQFDTTARGCSLGRAPTQVAYPTGIQVLVTSAASPYTYTTGTDTAAISADYQ
jgi:hypothetical protein